jgi:hypothetical protein
MMSIVMLSVTIKPIMLSVIMLRVVTPVDSPIKYGSNFTNFYLTYFIK